MIRRSFLGITLFAAVGAATAALAHHGWNSFDTRHAYYASGTITHVRWGKPRFTSAGAGVNGSPSRTQPHKDRAQPFCASRATSRGVAILVMALATSRHEGAGPKSGHFPVV